MEDGKDKAQLPRSVSSKNDRHPQDPIRISSSRSEKARVVARKWRFALGALIVGGIALGYFASGGRTHLKVEVKRSPISLTPPGVAQQSFQSRTQTRLHALGQSLGQLDAKQGTLGRRIDALGKQQRKWQMANSKNFGAINRDMIKIQQQLNEIAASNTSRRLPPAQPGPSRLPPPPSEFLPAGPLAGSHPLAGGHPLAGEQSAVARRPIVLVPPKAASGKKKVGVHVRYVKNPYAGYIPGGSFAPAVLLTGIEAGTAVSAQSNPQPVLMRVQRNAVLPDNARYKVSACFVIGSAYGSLSSQRAFIRLASISCVAKGKGMLLEAPIKGYAVDSDGMFGLRGKLVERRGALLAKTLLAGFASGLGTALSQAQGTAYAGTAGAGTALSGVSMLRSSMFTGASSAANQLAKFYLKEAEAIFPVIEVPPKRKITIVVTSGQTLKWHRNTVLYVPKVTPAK
jgi:conjugal transfer pilus assembly protein TraB